MKINEAKEIIKRDMKCTDYLDKASKGGWICPNCGSGTGEKGTGAVKYYEDTNKWYCHKCNAAGDILDLIQYRDNYSLPAAIKYAADQIGLIIDDPGADPLTPKDPGALDWGAEIGGKESDPKEPAQEKPADLTRYYEKCAERINDPAAVEYLTSRGISIETAAAFGIGYDPQADPGGSGYYREPRIILPVSEHYYIARRINSKGDNFDKLNNKGCIIDLFNKDLLFTGSETIFIVEGYFDALAIHEAGGQAIALNSANNARKLIDLLEKEPTKATLILALDNDDPGQKASAEIAAALQRLNISYITADLSGNQKDPNAALAEDRQEFEEAIAKAIKQTAAKPDDIGAYIENVMAAEIERYKNAQKIKTGFDNLDQKANGLHAGLYCIAAISSLGKTTFSHQIADNIAASGNDVLFFSLEQSRLELVSKSIARITAQQNKETAVTSLEIRQGKLTENVLKAADLYQQAAGGKMSIIEGNFNCNISFIGNYVRNYIKRNGGKENCKPVVIIDYLQILQADQDASYKQKREAVDLAVTELKRISRENEITVFIVSSVNRSNYLTPIDFESLKESGGIEYTCDVIWGLQLQALNDDIFSKKESIKEKREKIKAAKAAMPRKIELVCLKNRYGISSFNCYFDYYPQHDLFEAGNLSREFEPTQTAGRRL